MDAAKSGTRPYRLGAFLDGIGWVEHEYGRVWERLDNRFVVAPDRDQIDLILNLTEPLEGPFEVRYVLLVPRENGDDEGRFELATPLSRTELRAFLARYRRLFEDDGRHHLSIDSQKEEASILYDQHNVLYLKGPLAAFEEVLRRADLREGEVLFPSPHSHHYHDEHDGLLDDMLERYEWNWQPTTLV